MLLPLVTAVTILANGFACSASDAPPAPVAPAPEAVEVNTPAPEPPLPPMVRALARLGRPRIVIDGPACRSEWLELAFPAAAPHLREVRSETLLAVPRSTALDVRNFAGNISVQAWKRNAVRIVAAHSRRDHLLPLLENGTLSVTVVDAHGQPAFGDVTLLVPEWMPLKLSSVESAIDVEGIQAAVEAGSVRGDIVVRQSCGPLQLRSIEGGVKVRDARGHVQVASINNLVDLRDIIGLVDAESVNGDIQMTQVQSPDVEASSVNGSVVFTGPFQPRGRYKLTSHRGNLRVGVPVGSAVDVSVANYNGAFESGFPVQANPRTRGRRFTFTLGGGGSSLQLQSFDGLIQILRDDEAPLPPRAAPPPPPAPKEEQR